MPDEQTFLDEITANPDDDVPRLIYADWLEEHGNPRGEFIRVQVELETLRKTQKRYKELKAREQQLWLENAAEWTEGFPYSLRRWVFHRGFIEECSVALSYFCRNWEKILRMTPLRHVTFTQVKSQLAMLADCPGLSRLNSVRFKNQHARDGIQEFAASPYLTNIESIRGHWITEGLVELAKSSDASSLRELIFDGSMRDDGVRAICQAKHLKLERIDFAASIDRTAFREFCNAEFGPHLKELNINSVPVNDDDLLALVESSRLTNLRVFRASTWDFEDGVRGPGLIALANSPRLSLLRTLVLTNHPLSFESIVVVGESEHRKRGSRFYFGGSRHGYESRLSRAQIAELQERFGKTFGNL